MPKLCVMPGDGIGREVIPAAVTILQTVLPELEPVHAEAGWGCFEKWGESVPQETLDLIRATGAGLFGAVSSPMRPVAGYRSAILTIRQALNLYANIRPVQSWPQVSPRMGVDMIVVRENTEGLYSGLERSDGETAVAQRIITRQALDQTLFPDKTNRPTMILRCKFTGAKSSAYWVPTEPEKVRWSNRWSICCAARRGKSRC